MTASAKGRMRKVKETRSEMNSKLFEFISLCPTAYHAVAHVARRLESEGFLPLYEDGEWQLEPGKGYYVVRGGSSLIAFRAPDKNFSGFMMSASHCDSPAFKIKENAELADKNYLRLSTEKYGGMLCSTWLDRPLSVAGRVCIRTPGGFETRLVDFGAPVAVIPNVAIHMNRAANEGMSYNASVDMLPLFACGERGGAFFDALSEKAGAEKEDILSSDLFLYAPDKGIEWGDFISAPRLDDLQCAFASLDAFLASKQGESVPVYCLFDNEEVGSSTKQGAASTFLADVLEQICISKGLDRAEQKRKLAASFLLSCDNAHAVHPNHGEYADKNHSVYMNGGIVLKYNANQRYTSDAVSSAVFRLVSEEAGVPLQYYANRADMPGGSTLGNIANTKVSVNTVDIGLAQLAMHSAFETAGARDTAYMAKALTVFFGKSLALSGARNTYSLV